MESLIQNIILHYGLAFLECNPECKFLHFRMISLECKLHSGVGGRKQFPKSEMNEPFVMKAVIFNLMKMLSS